MFFASQDELIQHVRGVVSLENGGVKIEDPDRLRSQAIDTLVTNSVLNQSRELRGRSRFIIKSFQLFNRTWFDIIISHFMPFY